MQKENKNKNLKLRHFVNEINKWKYYGGFGQMLRKSGITLIWKLLLMLFSLILEIRLVMTDISFKFMNGIVFKSLNLAYFDRKTRSFNELRSRPEKTFILWWEGVRQFCPFFVLNYIKRANMWSFIGLKTTRKKRILWTAPYEYLFLLNIFMTSKLKS